MEEYLHPKLKLDLDSGEPIQESRLKIGKQKLLYFTSRGPGYRLDIVVPGVVKGWQVKDNTDGRKITLIDIINKAELKEKVRSQLIESFGKSANIQFWTPKCL